MPVRRRGDGEVVKEPTKQSRRRSERSGSPPSETPTEPAAPLLKDSILGDAPTRARERWDSTTKPVNRTALRGDGSREDATRILSPGRRRTTPTDESRPAPADPMADPPVGWLVIVRGPGKGNVLTLGNGMNAIGRGDSSRARLDFGDDNVSRVNHAQLAYDPRQRRWLLSHGEGANLTYLNGEVVMGTVDVASGAVIEVGETTLRFQAFCSQDFDWPDVED